MARSVKHHGPRFLISRAIERRVPDSERAPPIGHRGHADLRLQYVRGAMQAPSEAITISDRGSQDLAPAVALSAPVIPGYAIVRPIGRGGMGRVYQAEARDGSKVAIKTVALDRAGARDRFEREVWIGRTLEHPNVLHVLDAGIRGSVGWIALPLLEGTVLSETRRDPSFSFAERLLALCRTAIALDEIHARGVIHCDVKPQNIFLSRGDIVILDFGIALLRGDLCPCGAGTPKYMAPEVIRGDAIDQRADVFSFGVMAFEVLSGCSPWKSKEMSSRRARSFAEAALSGVVPIPLSLSTPLSDLIGRMLAPESSARVESAGTFARMVRQMIRPRSAVSLAA